MIRRLALVLVLALPLVAQKKALTLEALYDPEKRVHFAGAIQGGFDWVDDTAFVWPKTDEKGDLVEWRLFDVATGKSRALFDRLELQRALEAAGATAEDAKDAVALDELTFDAKKSQILFTIAGDLWLYSIAGGSVKRLTNTPEAEEEATFSPDGAKIAFVRGGNLFTLERQLTTDGGPQLLNGKLDYVYQEEIYGRGIFKGYWWSPDSTRIAFLQLDERPVPEFTVVDHIPYRLGLNVYDYPKAGDPNPPVKLFVADVGGGPLTRVRTSSSGFLGGPRSSSATATPPRNSEEPEEPDELIVNVHWSRHALTYQLQNREQTTLELFAVDPATGASRPILRESTQPFVEVLGAPAWLADGTFLWQSERDGYRHLYHYRADGTLLRQLTKGPWEVRDVHGADGQYVYFSGTERSPIESHVYRARLRDGRLQRLSQAAGTHVAVFNPSNTHYVDNWSDVQTPAQTRVHTNTGALAHVVDENKVAALSGYDIPRPEFLQIRTRDGFLMEAMLIKPPNFDPSKKYPVYQHVYGGPHVQRVLNRWDTNSLRGLFHPLVAQQGFVVFIVDNRSASGKGAVSAWPVYKNFGELELRDLEDAVAWLKQQPWIDGSRIAINGWSYGGFMVAYALTHSKTWSAGISGAPVLDWRDYDSIYTERYMRSPQNNPEGYRKSSPRFDAKNLHGRLLLIHGTTDDNVHAQNTLQFAYELQQLGKPFEMMLYPKTKHSVTNERTVFHLQQTVLDFLRRALLH
jgi:dipeptidyl-peptidase 4